MEVRQKTDWHKTLAYAKKWLAFWADFVSFFISEKNIVYKNLKWDIIEDRGLLITVHNMLKMKSQAGHDSAVY